MGLDQVVVLEDCRNMRINGGSSDPPALTQFRKDLGFKPPREIRSTA